MTITEQQLFTQFKNTVGKAGSPNDELVEAMKLQKWLLENEEELPEEWVETASFLCSAIIKERWSVWMSSIDNKINSKLDK
jgi:hypothetical protein